MPNFFSLRPDFLSKPMDFFLLTFFFLYKKNLYQKEIKWNKILQSKCELINKFHQNFKTWNSEIFFKNQNTKKDKCKSRDDVKKDKTM
jgi:hypothetical protein